MIMLSPEERKIVLDILKRYVPNREVWVFGSRATGKAKKYSDLDLAIISEESLSLHTQAQLSDDFDESALPFKVDILDWATTSDEFRAIIESTKVILLS